MPRQYEDEDEDEAYGRMIQRELDGENGDYFALAVGLARAQAAQVMDAKQADELMDQPWELPK